MEHLAYIKADTSTYDVSNWKQMFPFEYFALFWADEDCWKSAISIVLLKCITSFYSMCSKDILCAQHILYVLYTYSIFCTHTLCALHILCPIQIICVLHTCFRCLSSKKIQKLQLNCRWLVHSKVMTLNYGIYFQEECFTVSQ